MPDKKRVLFIANYFPPISGPGSYRPYYFIKYLHTKFKKITIITSDKDEIYGIDESLDVNFPNVEIIKFSGSNYNSFKKFLFKVRLYAFFNFLFPPFFWERQIGWYFRVLKWTKKNINSKDFDIIYATTGPFCSAMLAKEISSRTKIPFVVDMRDPFSLSPARNWMSYFHWKYFQNKERQILNTAKNVLMVAPSMKQHYLETFPEINYNKIQVVLNGFDGELFLEKINKTDQLIISYAGSLVDYDGNFKAEKIAWYKIPYKLVNYNTKTRSLYYLINAIALLPKEFANKLEVNIYGNHNLSFTKQLIEKNNLQHVVFFRGKQSFKTIHEKLASSDVLFLPMEERIDGGKSYFMTGKVYEYIQINKPILALGEKNDTTDLLDSIGYTYYQCIHNSKDLSAMLKNILDDKNNGKEFIGTNQNNNKLEVCKREFQANQLYKILINAAEN